MKKLLGVLAVAGLVLAATPARAQTYQAVVTKATVTVAGMVSPMLCVSIEARVSPCIRTNDPEFEISVDAKRSHTYVQFRYWEDADRLPLDGFQMAERMTVIVRSETVRREWLRRIRLARPSVPRDVLPTVKK